MMNGNIQQKDAVSESEYMERRKHLSNMIVAGPGKKVASMRSGTVTGPAGSDLLKAVKFPGVGNSSPSASLNSMER
jgi:hypothetical protein